MNRSEDILSCEEMGLLIEEYLDGELALGQAPLVERHLQRCEACAAELSLARRVRGALRSLPAQRCPDPISMAVIAQARSESGQRRGGWLRIAWAPLAAAAALLLAAGGWLVVHRGTPEPAYTAAEVKRAEHDIRWTLALLTDINRRAGMSLRDEVLEKRLVEPMRRTAEQTL